MSKEEKKKIEQLLDCSKCNLKECIGCEITYTDRKKIEEYIKQLETEIKREDKIIELMALFIANLDVDEDICKYQLEEFCKNKTEVNVDICVKCIKNYFTKKVEEEK